MIRLALLGLALTGCNAAAVESIVAENAPEIASCETSATCPWKTGAANDVATNRMAEGLPVEELAMVDVRGTATAAQEALRTIHTLQAGPVGDTRAAAQRLAVTCPYNRAGFQLAFALQLQASRIDPTTIDRVIESDWRYLQWGLATHVAALEALGADIPLPEAGDYLVDKLPPGAALTRADLAASKHPAGASMLLLDAIDPIVQDYTEEATDRIQADYAVLHAATGDDRLFKDLMRGWHRALVKIHPHVTDPYQAAQVQEMIAATEGWISRGC